MANFRKILPGLKLTVLTLVVIVSFIASSIGWRHYESSSSDRIIIAGAILVIMYALIIFELINRNLAALIGAAMAVAAYDCFVGFAEMEEIISWLDLETLSLLFGMMTIVNILGSSGLFNYLAIWAYQKSGGKFWLLISIFSAMTAILSAYIDNVSTMLLMAPTIIKLSELEHIDPRYVLMIMTVVSNIGGCSTPVGDPPNLIIIGDPLVNQLDINFGSFTAYATPCVILNTIVTLVYLRLVYKSKESFRLKKEDNPDLIESLPHESAVKVDLKQDISKESLHEDLKLLDSLKGQLSNAGNKLTDDTLRLVQIENQIAILDSALRDLKRRDMVLSMPVTQVERKGSRLTDAEILDLMQVYRIKSKSILIQSSAVLVVAVILFFLQAIPSIKLTLGWVALFAGLTLLVMSSASKVSTDEKEGDQHESEDNFEVVISKIEWSTLIFFFALFIVMEVMAKMGLILFMGNQITRLIDLAPAGQLRAVAAISIILWASGFASALVDNVPFTSMMIKVIGSMVVQSRMGRDSVPLDLKPLIFALSFGACFGGNATLIGASANLVTAGISARHGYPISFNKFFKFAAPITLITFIVANIYLVMVFVVLDL